MLTRTRQESAGIGEYLREAGVPFAFYKQEGCPDLLFVESEAAAGFAQVFTDLGALLAGAGSAQNVLRG